MKACPYCGEKIQDIAKKCRYCGEWLKEKKDTKKEEKKSEKNNSVVKKTSNLSAGKKINSKHEKLNYDKTYNAMNRRDKIIAGGLDFLLAITIIGGLINIYKVFKRGISLGFSRMGLDYYKKWDKIDNKIGLRRFLLYAPFIAAFAFPIILLFSILRFSLFSYYFFDFVTIIIGTLFSLNCIECLWNTSSFIDKLFGIEIKKIKESPEKYKNIPQEWDNLSEAQKSSLTKRFSIGIGSKILSLFFPRFYLLWTRNYLLFIIYIILNIILYATESGSYGEMISFILIFLIVIDLSFNLGRFAYNGESWKMKDYLLENKDLKDEGYANRCRKFNIGFGILLLIIAIVLFVFLLPGLNKAQQKAKQIQEEYQYKNDSGLDNTVVNFDDSYETKQLLKLIDGKPVYGNKSAGISIILFASPDIYVVKRLLIDEGTLQNIVDKSYGKINLIYNHFPIEEGAENAFSKSEIIACAMEKGNSNDVYNFIEEVINRDTLTVNGVYNILSKHGIDKTDVQKCVDMGIGKRKVNNDLSWIKNNGKTFGDIYGVPNIIVRNKNNNRYKIIDGAYPEETFIEAINEIM